VTPERWRAITEIFHGAIARAAPDREIYLAAACQTDPSLRADVDAMIAAHESGGGDLPAAAATDLELRPGTQLGVYRVESLIGAGGMGEVYRARDTRLDRIVAIKILPPHLRQSPELQARFEREARLVSQLTHPTICTLHDVGREGAIDFLVMEYVEGESLADRLEHGRVPLNQALQIAIDIASALAHAHRHGIVHRDLKPSNVMLTKTGAKLFDFGIAKAHRGLRTLESDPSLPTLASPGATSVTGIGAILGTVQYMAPEQLTGQIVDGRADIFALGVVIHEIVTGRKAFEGKTQASIIESILTDDPPPISTIQQSSPTALDFVVNKCFAKDPDDRWQSAHDVKSQLEWIARGSVSAATAPSASRRFTTIWRRETLAWALVGILTALSAMALLLLRPQTGDRGAQLQYTIVPPPGQLIAVPGYRRSIAISTDGRSVAYYSGTSNYIGPLVLRQLDQLEGRLIPDVLYAGEMTFSPDGRWIGFVDGLNIIWKVRVDGGPPVEIIRNTVGAGSLAWSDDDRIAFATLDPATGILRVSANGGDVEVLTRPDATHDEIDHAAPSFLPHGRGVVFSIIQRGGKQDVAALDLKTGRYKTLLRGGMPQYVEAFDGSGRRRQFLVFVVDNSVRAAPFDGDRLEVTGEPVILADQIYVTGDGKANYSISQTGTLVYMPATATAARLLVWVDRAGSVMPVPDAPSLAYTSPRLSPDGSVAAAGVGGNSHVATWSLRKRRLTQVTTGSGIDNFPIWLPNGRDLLFSSTRSGTVFNVYRQTADGSGAGDRVWTSGNNQFACDVLPDGTQALVVEQTTSGPSIYLVPTVAQRGKPNMVLANAENCRLSPDGKFMAYQSGESGHLEVYVRPFPETHSARWQASQGGGNSPAWSRDGKELFYLGPSDVMMAARTTSTGMTFNVEAPHKLFDASFARAGEYLNYDVAADGRFLMPRPDTGPAGSTSSTLVVKTRVFDVFK